MAWRSGNPIFGKRPSSEKGFWLLLGVGGCVLAYGCVV